MRSHSPPLGRGRGRGGVTNLFSGRKIQTPPPSPPLEGRGAAAHCYRTLVGTDLVSVRSCRSNFLRSCRSNFLRSCRSTFLRSCRSNFLRSCRSNFLRSCRSIFFRSCRSYIFHLRTDTRSVPTANDVSNWISYMKKMYHKTQALKERSICCRSFRALWRADSLISG